VSRYTRGWARPGPLRGSDMRRECLTSTADRAPKRP
jgi:hypothetical protein